MNPWLILGAVLAIGAAATGGYYVGKDDGKAEIQQAWDKEKAAQYAQYAKAMEESVEKQQQLQMGADRLRQEKDREIRDVTARNTALANSLRDRNERPTQGDTVSGTTGVGSSGCTGKELYRPDSEFLVRLAGEADELRFALKQCYTQYNAIRQK